jgi:shikimate dehydrogenase
MSTPEIRGSTRVTGVLGFPVAHSLSPLMHNAAFAALGLDFVYLPFEVRPEDLAQAVAGLRALQVAGVNVTIPHKVAIVRLLDSLSREAELTGAVNTVVRTREGRLIGYNTDGAGFLAALREEADMQPDGLRALIVGAGGAGRAVALSLGLGGALSVTITNRTPKRAEALSAELAAKVRASAFRPVAFTPEALRPVLAAVDLVVNCTAVGMKGESFDVPLPLEALPTHAVVADVVYLSGGTPLLREATRLGRRCFGGLGMLVHQGAIAQELWTGVRPPVSLLREATRAAFSE